MGVLHRFLAEIGHQVGDLGGIQFRVEPGLFGGLVLFQGHEEQVGVVLEEVLHAQVSLGDAADGGQLCRLGLHLHQAIVDVGGGALDVGSPGHDLVHQVVALQEKQRVGLAGFPQDDLGGGGIQGDGPVGHISDGQCAAGGTRTGCFGRLVPVAARRDGGHPQRPRSSCQKSPAFHIHAPCRHDGAIVFGGVGQIELPGTPTASFQRES